MKIVYTIGHTNYSIEQFVEILRHYEINCVVDVRSTPYSKYTPQFNSMGLKEELKNRGIIYIHMGEEFGARREEKEFYTHGYLDFEKVRQQSISFFRGVQRIDEGCKKGYRISLMCTEKIPSECHRSIMVTKGLKDAGFEIRHIISKEKVMEQQDVEDELLEKYYPLRNQVTLDTLMCEPIPKEELIEDCYRRRNKEIGYVIEEE